MCDWLFPSENNEVGRFVQNISAAVEMMMMMRSSQLRIHPDQSEVRRVFITPLTVSSACSEPLHKVVLCQTKRHWVTKGNAFLRLHFCVSSATRQFFKPSTRAASLHTQSAAFQWQLPAALQPSFTIIRDLEICSPVILSRTRCPYEDQKWSHHI